MTLQLRLLFFVVILISNPLLGAAAVAQQIMSKPARVMWISVFPLGQVSTYLDAFRSGLAEEGYVEGRDIEVIARSADGDPDRMPALLNEIVGMKPDVIVSQGAAIFSAREIKQIPVVYGFSGDPMAAGLADSLARPRGNLTGVSFMSVELNAKRLDLLREAAPQARRIVLMGDPVHPGVDLEIKASQDMAQQLGMEMQWVPTRNTKEVADHLARLETDRPDALVVLPDSVMLESRKQVAAFATKHRIPAISGWSTFAHSGGLFTYGPRLQESFKRLAYYTARILKGTKPSDLPVEIPTRFELVINLKSAKEMGLTMPSALIAVADEVID
jgi:putative ABC transport system substrate-binding protein